MKVYVVACFLVDLEDSPNEIASIMSATFSKLTDAQDYLNTLASKYEDGESRYVEYTTKEGIAKIELIDEESQATYFTATIIETEVDEFVKKS